MAGSRTATLPESSLQGVVTSVLAQAGIGAGDRLCVALSGGVDSVVLTDLLVELSRKTGFAVEAAHVHHGLSGRADAWALFCAQLCRTWGIMFRRLDVEVARGEGRGLEAAARRVRHAALASVDTDWLVFGHHLDDQVETVLFRLARGTGVRGAAGMVAIEPAGTSRAGRLRPLLASSREEIIAHARARGLEWVEDESNNDLRFSRNYLRTVVLPAFARGFPGLGRSLCRAAENFREADELLETLALIDRQNCAPDCAGTLSVVALLDLPDPQVLNLLRSELRRLGLLAPSRSRLVEAVRQLRAAPDRPLWLPLGESVCCAYRGRVWIESEVARPTVAVPWRGQASVEWGGGEVQFACSVGRGVSMSRVEVAQSVAIAPRWAGLAMRVGPGRPRRSLRKLCQDAGVPAWMRDALPILEVDGEAAWIGAIGVSGDFRCEAGEPGLTLVWRRSRDAPPSCAGDLRRPFSDLSR